jgi:energy-coupling factor transporter ATP-binding protein EcfA2
MKGLKFPYASLYQDNWDDFGWKCRFTARLHISEDQTIDLGGLRIAKDDKGLRFRELPCIIDAMPRKIASLAESIAYYRKLRNLPARLRRSYLSEIGDIVARPKRRESITSEDLWNKSFMRETSSRHAFKRGAVYIGGKPEEIIPPKFSFSMKLPDAATSHNLEVDFSPDNELPHRTILLIGRNGTGKTRTLSSLAFAMMPPQVFSKETISNQPKTSVEPETSISRIITISYNAFDEFPLPSEPTRAPRLLGTNYRSRASYKYCGLRTPDGTINADEISKMLGEALEPVATSEREDVLLRVLETLLGEELASALCADDETRDQAVKSLSAGQRLVTAIFCNIIGFIEEGSLLLIDEPETNLHPGLLTSVIAALNDVLHEYDSYSIIATHSPILLQQIPSGFVRIFTRHDDSPKIMEPDFETFGEDLGELSRRVLGLADPERDFTSILDRLFSKHESAQAVEALFPFALGVPARAYLYSLEDENDDEQTRS